MRGLPWVISGPKNKIALERQKLRIIPQTSIIDMPPFDWVEPVTLNNDKKRVECYCKLKARHHKCIDRNASMEGSKRWTIGLGLVSAFNN